MPTKEPEDLREKMLNECHWKFVNEKGVSCVHTKEFPRAYVEQAKIAMDAYFEARSMEWLEYMAKNNVECEMVDYGKGFIPVFLYKGEWITREQLFQNFL